MSTMLLYSSIMMEETMTSSRSVICSSTSTGEVCACVGVAIRGARRRVVVVTGHVRWPIVHKMGVSPPHDALFAKPDDYLHRTVDKREDMIQHA